MTDTDDPKGLIRDAYLIDGISEPECRSIFLDWALTVPEEDPRPRIPRLLQRHGVAGHPMSKVLRAALDQAPATGRRGGRAARIAREEGR